MAAPFTDPALIRGNLYATSDRLEQRTSALHRAKTGGADAAATIAVLAAASNPAPARVLDIGCGRGTSTLRLARQFPAAAVIATDLSPALLATAGGRLAAQPGDASFVAADFHHLPFATGIVDVAVAGFCLYHSPRPDQALTEITRCLRPGAYAIVTTKSADSYHAIDTLIADSGLDPDAVTRPSLYQSFHTGNAAQVAATVGLRIARRVDQEHTFRFAGLAHLAEYAVTNPKYLLSAHLTGNPQRLAAELRRRRPDTPVTATSTVTYLVIRRP
jgi:ubiquinone/menaquinone biosynthesis C-methylase UbiE